MPKLPNDPFPEPVRPPKPPAQTPSDPVNVPAPAPDVIFPADEPLELPIPGADIPPLMEPPMIA